MRNYSKNIYRTALKNRGSLLGAVLIIAIGIFVYVSMFDTLRNLQNQILHYYDEYALADIFAEVRGISVQQQALRVLKEYRLIAPQMLLVPHRAQRQHCLTVLVEVEEDPVAEEQVFQAGSDCRESWDTSGVSESACRAK